MVRMIQTCLMIDHNRITKLKFFSDDKAVVFVVCLDSYLFSRSVKMCLHFKFFLFVFLCVH